MHYAILAAGEGSRLGSVSAKPLVTINGKTLSQRMLDIIAQRSDVESVTIITNSEKPEIEAHLRTLKYPFELNIISAHTPSAAHSLAEVVRNIPRGEKLVGLTVDTVFVTKEFHEYLDAFAAMEDHDVLMGVTRFVDDEKPLYVEVAPDMRIKAFGDFPTEAAEHVSAGIYGLGPAARDVIDLSMAIGVNGLREFQRALLLRDLDVRAHEMGKVFDVDRPHDLIEAREFILEQELGAE